MVLGKVDLFADHLFKTELKQLSNKPQPTEHIRIIQLPKSRFTHRVSESWPSSPASIAIAKA
jgi:hypothetical protein